MPEPDLVAEFDTEPDKEGRLVTDTLSNGVIDVVTLEKGVPVPYRVGVEYLNMSEKR